MLGFCGVIAGCDDFVEIAAWARHHEGFFRTFSVGFMPTSVMRKDTLGQDTLYGATLTYAAFGRKVLTDEQVLRH